MGELEEMMNKVLSSPDDMSRIMQLAQSLTSGTPEGGLGPQPGKAEATDSGADPELAALLSRIMRGISSSSGDSKTALISALKPYLREERRSKIDRAVKIAKLAKIATGAFGDMGGGDNAL